MFKPKSFNEIFTDMRDRTGLAITDFEVGSVARTMYESFAYEIALLYEKLYQVYLSAYIDTAQGQQLDMVVAILGIKRNQPDFAAGTVIFERDRGNEDIEIPLNTLVATADSEAAPQKTYQTIEPAILPKDHTTVEVKVQAVQRGEEQTTPAETVVVMPRPISAIKAVINRDPIRFRGRRRETDEALRERAKNAIIASGKATIFSIENALLSLPGVRDILVTEYFHLARGQVTLERTEAGQKLAIGQGVRLIAVETTGAEGQVVEKPFQTVETNSFGEADLSITITVQALIAGQAGQVFQTGDKVTWRFARDDATLAGLAISNATPILMGQFGVVEVAVDSIDFRDPGSPAYEKERERLQNVIDQVRAAGVMARLKSATIMQVDGIFEIEIDPNLRLSTAERIEIEEQVRAEIINYISERKMGQPLLFSQVIRLALSQDGVGNMENFTITTNQEDGSRDSYDPTHKRIDTEPSGKFTPRYICVASETKPLPIHIQFRAEGLDSDKLKQVLDNLKAYFSTEGIEIKGSLITHEIQPLLGQVKEVKLTPEPWCPHDILRQEGDEVTIQASFVERPVLGDLFAYDKCLNVTGALKLLLPSTITGDEKLRVRAEIEAGIRDYFEKLKAEADIVFEELIAIATAVDSVLNVSLDPADFWVTIAPGCDMEKGLVIDNTRVADDKISIEAFEKATIKHFCITGDVEKVRIEATSVEIEATRVVTVTDPPPKDFSEDQLISDTQQRVKRAVKEAINNFLIDAAPGEDVIYADLKNAIQNLVPGINYNVKTLALWASSLADGRVQEVPLVVEDQVLVSDIHIRSVEVAFMQPIPLEPPPPFRLDPRLQGELDVESGQLSAGLRNDFAQNDIYLSDQVIIEKAEVEWRIVDRGQRRTYLVRREDDLLNVYQKEPIQVQVTLEKVIVPGS